MLNIKKINFYTVKDTFKKIKKKIKMIKSYCLIEKKNFLK